MSGKGLAAHYHFSRQPGIFGDRMVFVQVTVTNTTDQKIENIHIKEKKLPPGMRMHEFNPIGNFIISWKIWNLNLLQNLKYRKVALHSHAYTSIHMYLYTRTHVYVCIHTHSCNYLLLGNLFLTKIEFSFPLPVFDFGNNSLDQNFHAWKQPAIPVDIINFFCLPTSLDSLTT